MNRQHAAILVPAGTLFFYLLFRPEAGIVAYAILGLMWAASAALDLWSTFANKQYILRYERSCILLFFYSRLTKSRTILAVVLTEAGCAILLPVVFLFEINLGCTMAVGYFFTVLHAMAASQNEEFSRRHTIPD